MGKYKYIKIVLEGGRINYLDALKCLGILLVIEGHVWTFGMGLGTYDSLSALMLYSFNMPIFFFVSGFLAHKDSLSFKQVGKKLWQKFLFLIIPAVVFKVFIDLLHGQNPVNFLYQGLGGYWFTVTLFECFLIYYLVLIIVKRSGLQMIILAATALIGIGLLSIYGEFGPKLLDMNRLTKYFQYFVFGLLAMRYKDMYERTMNNEWLKVGTIIAYFALLFTINNLPAPSSVFHISRDLVLRYLGTFIVVSFFVCRKEVFDSDTRTNRLICKIGQKSLPIYLLQYFFIPSFGAWSEWISRLDGFTVHVISFVYTIIITAACMLFIILLSNSSMVRKYILGINR